MENMLLEQDLEYSLPTNALIEQTLPFRTLMMRYSCAVKEITTKFEILDNDLAMKNNRNPIKFITHRIKKPISIVNKLSKREFPVSVESIEENLNDVAGVRVICAFIDDIYQVANMLIAQDDIEVVEIKDYIQSPKSNGYRSYHMIVEVPVFFSDSKVNMRVEVQFRTIAMDFWASLDHQLKYKKSIDNEKEISVRLASCANVIAAIDGEMQNIREQIDENAKIYEEVMNKKENHENLI